ncbi:MAG: hypothetical protein IJ158_03330 [Treponema sp.]|nr:hypothetical protein [Treponema sp.]
MENELIFTQERTISSAFIDSSLKMGIAQSVLMVQDNLTECFNKLGCDGVIYREKYNAFWVFTKSKLIFKRRPDWREKLSASTFPVDNAGFKAHINTILKDLNGETLIIANQEACVLDMEKHRPVKLTNLNYPKENFPEAVFTEQFEKFDADFTEDDFKYEQIIRAQHIDMSHHMNNIEYIKLALNVFTDDFLLSHEVKSLEVHYTGESKEGQTLRIYGKTNGNTTNVVIKESERSVFEMKIEF